MVQLGIPKPTGLLFYDPQKLPVLFVESDPASPCPSHFTLPNHLLLVTISRQKNCYYPHLIDEKQRPREVKGFDQRHIASKWQGQDTNTPVVWALKSTFLALSPGLE